MQSKPASSPAFRVLGFDTSTERLAVGLSLAQGASGGAASLLTTEADGGAQASATLLPHVEALLERAGLTLAEIDFIAFGRGPGAFTGLRTACAVAQGLGLGLGKPLLAIDSLLIVAEDARWQTDADAAHFEVGVVVDARMDEVYAAVYRWQAGCWRVGQAPALMRLPALAEAWGGATLDAVAGSGLAAFGPRLGLPASAVQVAVERDRAAALLRLAQVAAAAGEGVDAAAGLPLYLRDKVAQTTSERDAERAARRFVP
jgi:tRNA threonylcarbamoyladenosine biosynthesis protein TsaB